MNTPSEIYSAVVDFLYLAMGSGDIEVRNIEQLKEALYKHLDKALWHGSDEINWYNDED